MRTLLTYRDARLLLAGQTLSAFGDWAMLIVLAVWMKVLTGSSALAGLTFFTFAAGSLLAPLGGLLADRVRRRPLMMQTCNRGWRARRSRSRRVPGSSDTHSGRAARRTRVPSKSRKSVIAGAARSRGATTFQFSNK